MVTENRIFYRVRGAQGRKTTYFTVSGAPGGRKPRVLPCPGRPRGRKPRVLPCPGCPVGRKLCILLCPGRRGATHTHTLTHGFARESFQPLSAETHIAGRIRPDSAGFGRIRSDLTILGPAWGPGPEGGPLSLRSSDRFVLSRRQGSADKYIILCERVGVCPKTLRSGDLR